MSVFLSSSETDAEVVLQWHSTEVGDTVENSAGVTTEHPTLIAAGKVSLAVADDPAEEFEAPHIIVLPVNEPYTFTVVATGTMFCVYNKASGAADEIQHLVTSGTVVFS